MSLSNFFGLENHKCWPTLETRMRKYGSYPLPDKQSAFVMMIMIWVAFTFLTESLFAMGTKSFLSLSIHLFSNLSRFYFLTESPFQWVKIIFVIIDPFSPNLSHFYFFRCVFSSSISETNFLSLLIHLSSYLSHFQFFNW